MRIHQYHTAGGNTTAECLLRERSLVPVVAKGRCFSSLLLIPQRVQHLSCGQPHIPASVPVCPLGRPDFARKGCVARGTACESDKATQVAPKAVNDLGATLDIQGSTARELHLVHFGVVRLDPSHLRKGMMAYLLETVSSDTFLFSIIRPCH